MDKRKHLLIFIDAVVNLVIGTVLLLSPWGVLRLLGLPPTSSLFYPMILGAVILGIGLALLLETGSSKAHQHGLGIKGAIAINLCGGGMLLAWLIFFPVTLPLRGTLILWTVAISVLLLGIIELVSARPGQSG